LFFSTTYRRYSGAVPVKHPSCVDYPTSLPAWLPNNDDHVALKGETWDAPSIAFATFLPCKQQQRFLHLVQLYVSVERRADIQGIWKEVDGDTIGYDMTHK
jgi:hypothetical protein